MSFEKATPRPWALFPTNKGDWPGIEGSLDSGVSVVVWGGSEEDAGVRGEDLASAEENAALIVYAVNNIEALQAEAKVLREALENARKSFERLEGRLKPLPDDCPEDDKRDKRKGYAIAVKAVAQIKAVLS